MIVEAKDELRPYIESCPCPVIGSNPVCRPDHGAHDRRAWNRPRFAVGCMKRTLVWSSALLAACVLGLAGCTTRSDVAAPSVPDPAHSSRNSIDWAGTYEGVTPCADCPGIRMRLTLQRDGRFELSTQYLDRQVAPQTVRGLFTWNVDGNTVTLEGAGAGRQFRVGEGRLLLLDRDGGVPSWNTPHRVLTLQPR
jgi:uncharacterized lipoprotein NlpE involved in copper resistance